MNKSKIILGENEFDFNIKRRLISKNQNHKQSLQELFQTNNLPILSNNQLNHIQAPNINSLPILSNNQSIHIQETKINTGWIKNTEFMLFDGTFKKVQDIRIGDKLMGANSMASVVDNISKVFSNDIYEIIPTQKSGKNKITVNNDPFIVLKCNVKPHIEERKEKNLPYNGKYFVLINNQLTRICKCFKTRIEAEKFISDKNKNGIIWEVSIKEFINSKNIIQHSSKMIRSNLITFNPPNFSLQNTLNQIFTKKFNSNNIINEYFINLTAWCLGMWLSDGNSKDQWISQGGPAHPNKGHHQEAMDGLLKWGTASGTTVKQVFDKISTAGNAAYFFKFPLEFREILKIYNLLNNKHFPYALLTESVEIRMHLLGGMIDGDGHYQNTCYEISCKYLDFAKGLKFLAESLGFCVNKIGNKEVILDKNTGEKWYGYRLNIFGNNLTNLNPYIHISYKKNSASKSDKLKNSHSWGVKINKLGESLDEFYGLSISSFNKQVIMKDFSIAYIH